MGYSQVDNYERYSDFDWSCALKRSLEKKKKKVGPTNFFSSCEKKVRQTKLR